ncbi:hypothetical protein K6U06_20925 [Acidiferrimicrobium sp. IK]|uniref:hypothetical protein n=1 Tax=Acidiferrimicrobium sp. IK TaxID=2871700 RepID=UPI0021CB9513|nr:hypothetical protein [Acidiferrimicrobium sp. IK]MCU4186842.1 hypothetical protein [Acidiferrimicrobium sp. IK]
MASTMTTDDLYATVQELTTIDQAAAVARLSELVSDNRAELGEVRNRFAARLHGHSDDYQATAALTLLNRSLATVARHEPLDWKTRWAKGRKP